MAAISQLGNLQTPKKNMITGQHECIFKQCTFTKKFWTLHDRTKERIPKGKGQGLMLVLLLL